MSSSSPEQEVVHHSTHIHLLRLGVGRFVCDGCNEVESGKVYHCADCNYSLDKFCAICPPTLLSSSHHKHELQLVLRDKKHACDICSESVKGVFCYICEACDFDVHPVCLVLPQGQVPRHSKRERVARTLKAVALGVAGNLIASPISDLLKDLF